MFICFFCCFAAARCSLKISLLYQEWLVHFFDSFCFFTNSSCNGGDTNRSAFKLVDNGGENTIVHVIKTVLIYIEGLECHLSDRPCDGAVAFDLCEVPGSSK